MDLEIIRKRSETKRSETRMKMKETLHLGKTAFPMRGNLPNREVDWQKNGKKIDCINAVKIK